MALEHNQHRRKAYVRRLIRTDDGAVSNIVTSIMMLGIVFTILGMILTVYVPVWAKSQEATHMEDVANSFTELKSTVDAQIAQGDLGTKMSTRVKLGTEGGPLLGLGQSTGGLLFQPESSQMSIYNTDDAFEKYGTGRGKLSYQASNIYYVEQQYVYENGAVILEQQGSTLMKVEPNIYIDNVSGTTTISSVLITLQGDLENVGGIRSQSVQTSLLSVNRDTVNWGDGAVPGSGKNITITVNTSFPKVWHEYFKDLLNNRSRLSADEYTITVPYRSEDPDDELYLIDVTVYDVNKFSTTIAYVDTKIT